MVQILKVRPKTYLQLVLIKIYHCYLTWEDDNKYMFFLLGNELSLLKSN